MDDKKPLLSFSRIKMVEKCPYLFHLVVNEGWREAPTAPQALGQSLHGALDLFFSLEQKKWTVERLLEEYDRAWVNEGFQNVDEILETREKGKKFLIDFFRIGLPEKESSTEPEKKFSIEFDDFFLNGTVDRFDVPKKGPPLVVEYKTSERGWTPEKIKRDEQMTFYALGAEKAWGVKNVRLAYLFLNSATAVETKRSDAEKDAILQKAQRVARKILSKDFSPNHASCAKCEMRKRCPEARL